MTVTILGKRWRFGFAKTIDAKQSRGACDSPDKRGKRICIRGDLAGEERLEVIVHELLHAANWSLDEEFVEQAGRDLAAVLWRLGYRCELES